jgi:hypothetical protein
MFAEELSQKHWDQARKSEAIMTQTATFEYAEEGEEFDRHAELRMNYPATELTRRLAN